MFSSLARRSLALALLVPASGALASGAQTPALAEWVGGAGYDHFGSAGAVGDLDEDGFGDVIARMTVPSGASPEPTAVAVFLGPHQGLVSTDDAFALLVPPEITDDFGDAVILGDLNADAVPDLVVGATRPEGGVAVYFGPITGGRPAPDLEIQPSPGTTPGFGDALAVGVVDGDGIDDLVLGIPGLGDAEGDYAGGVVIQYGPLSAGIQLLQEGPSATIYGTWPAGRLGSRVAVGDLDGDGRGDVLASSPFYGLEDWGAVMRFAPLPGDVLRETDASARIFGRRPALECEHLDHLCRLSGSELGRDIEVADFDGDGRDDLALTGLYAGDHEEVYVFLEAPEGRMSVSDADATASIDGGIEIIGLDIAAAGDADGDGASELLAKVRIGEGDTAVRATMQCPLDALVFGDLEGGCRFIYAFDDQRNAAPLGTVGDLDGDGADDLVLCDPLSDDGGSDKGACLAVPGDPAPGTVNVLGLSP